MEIDHFCHPHPLTLCHEEERLICNGCRLKISGPVYGCKICNFHLHQSCAELPFEKLHRFHQQHPLFLRILPENSTLSKCSKCYDRSLGFSYHCGKCCFTLDHKCASLTEITVPREDGSVQRNESIDHFIHEHSLILYSSWEESTSTTAAMCSVCQLPLISGSRIYCCVQCLFFLHETCIKIEGGMQHPFHFHYLTARARLSHVVCGACKIKFRGVSFCCDSCGFDLHVGCAISESEMQMTALKHECHEHDLYYFQSDNDVGQFLCNVCEACCVGSFFRCVKCDLNLHFECIPLPQILTCEFHSHRPLTFLDSFVEDDSGQYYCDACETTRNPEHSIYYCDDCKHIAHVNCAVSRSMEVLEYMGPRPKIVKSDHYIHQHTLTLREEKGLRCNGCSLIISGPAYGCVSCHFYLHESCAELPFQIGHPAHRQHPLFLRCLAETCRCSVCYDEWKGFTYHCGRCSITLDLKCASPSLLAPSLEELHREIPITHVECDESEVESKSEEQKSDAEEGSGNDSEEQESDAEEQRSDAKEPTIAELIEMINGLRFEVETLKRNRFEFETLKRKVETITVELEALRGERPNM